jgi:enediyne biosynthesis protein E4
MGLRQAGLALLVIVAGCGSSGGQAAGVPTAAPAPEWFVDRAVESGIDFVHINGMTGQLYMPEILAPGVALYDYDNDGDLDVYLVQSGGFDGQRPNDRLYRNDLTVRPEGTRSLHFTDVTAASGIEAHGYGMGVATGDFNNDGWVDLYLTKFDAPNQLLRNNGNGTFTDVSKASGTDQRSWSVSAAFVDFDRDGWLDLYVGNYLRYRLEGNTRCSSPTGAPDYCTPSSYPALPGRLYRNQRNGTFADVTTSSRVGSEYGPALGVATADFNGDGWMDIYVANDGKENQLWLNRHNGTFENGALLAGVALPSSGKAEGSMGVDAGDFDNDGDDDLVMTELTAEGSNLYVNDGTGVFTDASAPSAIGPASLPFTGFGAVWFDFDNDGLLDFVAANGTVQIVEALRQAKDPFPMHQKKLLLRNAGGGRLEDVTAKAGAAFALSEVGRGLAVGDVDNDGDLDLLIGNNNGHTRLLMNQAAVGKHWLGIKMAVGSRVEVIRQKGGSLWRRSRADGSYASANDPRVLVGLGDDGGAVSVRVRWPSGRSEMFADVMVDRYLTLTEGTGK